MEKKIRKLLAMYGAEEREIENFMADLKEMKEELQSDDFDDEEEFGYYDTDTMNKLNATKEGKQLIADAPSMAKDKLEQAIKKFLGN